MFLEVISSTSGEGRILNNSFDTVFRGSLKKCEFLMNLRRKWYEKAFRAYRKVYQEHQLDSFEQDQGFRDYEVACLL